MQFYPEGQNPVKGPYSFSKLEYAYRTGAVLEACAAAFNTEKQLVFHLGCCTGVIPYEECANGIREGTVREIAVLTRVGRPCCFTVTSLPDDSDSVCMLSRRAAQLMCLEKKLDTLIPGNVISCLVTSLESFGAFCDVGCGISALLPIDCMSVSRIASPTDRLRPFETLRCVVKQRDAQGRLVLSLKELLGTWEENAALYKAGETVTGIVRSVENYGVFIELTPNLTGLAEPTEGVIPGQAVSVYIKSILPDKMKIKLVILSTLGKAAAPSSPTYFVTENHLDRWNYSPLSCQKQIVTTF